VQERSIAIIDVNLTQIKINFQQSPLKKLTIHNPPTMQISAVKSPMRLMRCRAHKNGLKSGFAACQEKYNRLYFCLLTFP